MATKSEISTKVLEHFGLLDPQDSIDSDDDTLLQDMYDSCYQMMQAEHLVSWGSGDNIPTAFEVPVTRYVAFYAAKVFGQQPDPADLLVAKQDMRMLLRSDPSNLPVQADYF